MARLPLAFFPDARVDALEAYDWYAERSQEAADAFQSELEDARRGIQESPERWAKYFQGLTIAQVGARMNRSDGSVKKLLAHALLRLRGYLDESD